MFACPWSQIGKQLSNQTYKWLPYKVRRPFKNNEEIEEISWLFFFTKIGVFVSVYFPIMPFKSLLNAHLLQTHRLSRSRCGLDLKSSRAKNRDNPNDITLTKSQDASASTSLQQHVLSFFFQVVCCWKCAPKFLVSRLFTCSFLKSCFLWRFLWQFLWCTSGL